MRTKRITLDLPVPLPADQLQSLSGAIAKKVGERDEVQADKAHSLKAFNQQLAHCDADISELAGKIRTGSMEAGVECEVTMDDPAPGFKTTRRLDTGATVGAEPQPMDEADRQEELFTPGEAPLDLEKLAELPDDRQAPIKDPEPDASKGEEPPPTPPGWTQQPDDQPPQNS